MLTALVIDDEQFSREELITLLAETGDIEIIGEAPNAILGLKKINELKPDVVFLDIQMPKVTGLELLSMLDPESMPFVVFVTAYDQYAIEAFEESAFDYLLKPVEPNRLIKTVHKLTRIVKKQSAPQNLSALAPETLTQIPCTGHNRILLVPINQVESIYSDIRGVHVHTPDQTPTTPLTLKTLEEKTPLLRCHRQYLVNVNHIREIKLLENGVGEVVTCSGLKIPISRRYLKTLKEVIGLTS
ncbi:two-component system response regulator YehT [Grimontia hollisae]|uniref:Response regulator of the LytR/AlgR family n=2 Tax=Grimontia hollisae TaxID=673 RepID=D0I6G4_GRIHO|nr:two-component system response regulator BtsR [Grimontia hollisae]AMG31575.1 two-component system response regulator YehT [Grimontia hollisae]EEY72233.1 response regulator of the LytR/AlgR family [Grimontia hollisae CIP 101886]MDF2185946.1 two-component system response regulator BtsR [Grimontia hollisae]STO45316.1 Probable transcriptional regulatory protein YehT [Grimontia hollisae]STO57836.1 Probable transcriptional regulatory protein YehT [Grimontia hollisae]